MKKVTLVQMKAGEKGTVIAFDGGKGLENRLSNMGIRLGKTVVKLSFFVMRGPVAVRCGHTVLALGYGMAAKVWVEISKK